MKEIPLTRGLFAMVDDSDFDELSMVLWQASPDSSGRFRATRKVARGSAVLHMGRVILGEPDGVVDHIDGNALNNQRHNLRVVTRLQNSWNRLKSKNGSSRYKGVHYLAKWGTWKAQIKCNGRQYQLGHFKDEETAAAAYRLKAEELYGEFAGLSGLPSRERALELLAAATKPAKYRGVWKAGNSWRAAVREGGRTVNIGSFPTQDAAAEAVAARKAVIYAG